MCISVKVLVQAGIQQVPWEEQSQTLSGSLFPVSCSAADVKEDFHWNTERSCKFWLCPKYSGTCPKKISKKNGQLGPLLVQIFFGNIFFPAKEPNKDGILAQMSFKKI